MALPGTHHLTDRLRDHVVSELHAAVGAHDEPEIYSEPAGDPGLVGPGSVSWELHSSIGTIAAAGMAAIIMEVLHPSVMAGVHDQSTYRTQPERRARNTFGYVVVTTFGSTAAAEGLIRRVHRMHARVNGTRPDGQPYEALDPRLIGWVHTAIPWAILQAYDRYKRPLSTSEKDRYLREQVVIGRLSGAGDIPVTAAELDEYVEAMRPELAVNEQTRSFLDFLVGAVPEQPAGRLEQANRRLGLHAAMRLMPEWARHLTGLEHPDVAQRLWFDPTSRRNVDLVDWAVGVPAYRRLAEARALGRPAEAAA